ncbi:Subtilisin-like serine protease [Madurella fahalii]|uniref:Subtilisin-like serine protease n=1 Tax=Madurella fahalii TaxID=1157608 RepID=A0ABQ0GCY4_9PEZI
MSLCQLCQGIDFAAFTVHAQRRSSAQQRFNCPSEGAHGYFFYPVEGHGKECNKPSSIFIPHHKTIDALMSSAITCTLCDLIAACFETTLHQRQRARELGYGIDFPDYEFWMCGRYAADGFQILGRPLPGSEGATNFDNTVYDLIGGIGFCVSDDDILADFVTGRVVPPSPVSPHVLERIKIWLAKHSPQFHTKLPTRLLGISSDGLEVALQEPSEGSLGKYVALSHCWGSTQPTVLTEGTAGGLRAGIKSGTLPQTIQDAVWLAHKLGFQLLWVDSLCKFQDDAQDWAKESARMTEVYGSAALTIAADCAASSDEGFLSDRPERKFVPLPISFEDHNVTGKILAFPLPKKYAGDTNRCVFLETEPLSKRGWALQERYLSPCTLHFGREQIFFESNRSFVPEDICSARSTCFLERAWQSSRPLTISAHRFLRNGWFSVVEQYSRRKLTMPNDKLPALAGLAKLFAKQTSSLRDSGVYVNARYLAGLWSNSLADLCWMLDKHCDQGARPNVYRAPSWSWASIDGDIDYRDGRSLLSDPDLSMATVQDGGVDLCGVEAPFGEVRRGWIRLRGMLLQLTDWNPHTDSGWCGFQICEEGIPLGLPPYWDAEAYRIYFSKDVVRPMDEKTKLWVIPLAWLTTNRDPRHISGPFFLIVKAAEHAIPAFRGIPAFQRVGTIYGHLNKPSDPKQTQLSRDILEEKWAMANTNGGFEDILLL